MGIFDDKEARKKIQYLEEERKKLWDRIIKLEEQNRLIRNEITAKTSESQLEAAQSSKKAAEFRNKTEVRLNEANDFVTKITAKFKEAETLYSNIFEKNDEAVSLKTKIETIDSEYRELYNELKSKIEYIDNFTEEYPDLDDKLGEISNFISNIENNLNKSKTTLNSINNRKKEIEEFYENIFGYTDTDENGEEIFIEGKKELLEELYSNLETEIELSKEKISKINEDYKNKYSSFESTYKSKYESIIQEIGKLLPNALTAGLSAAFSQKKKVEEELSEKLQKRFSRGITYLICVSIIPFVISIYYLIEGHQLDESLLKLPRLVLAIIPMYIPVLWFTYSSNKRLNLSKRLIEEYSHKEVLSKTYEGLSTQIANIEDEEQSEELRFKLLSTFLQVASENPGKLISNYNTSDHPFMEALEQSYKFQIAIDKLEGIPGMGKIIAILEKKAKKKIEEKEEAINNVLSNVSVDNNE